MRSEDATLPSTSIGLVQWQAKKQLGARHAGSTHLGRGLKPALALHVAKFVRAGLRRQLVEHNDTRSQLRDPLVQASATEQPQHTTPQHTEHNHIVAGNGYTLATQACALVTPASTKRDNSPLRHPTRWGACPVWRARCSPGRCCSDTSQTSPPRVARPWTAHAWRRDRRMQSNHSQVAREIPTGWAAESQTAQTGSV